MILLFYGCVCVCACIRMSALWWGYFDGAIKMNLIACHRKLLSPAIEHIQWFQTPMDMSRIYNNFFKHEEMIMLIDWKLNGNPSREIIHKIKWNYIGNLNFCQTATELSFNFYKLKKKYEIWMKKHKIKHQFGKYVEMQAKMSFCRGKSLKTRSKVIELTHR